ncbi:VOC family protein [Nonomuraea sp. NPDC050383]|uniref:VOC family protein n=1 Tax=Nonomuraea sp. NPDC050383 TaxID=3364362 RepID=UPI0037A5E4C3
MFKTVASATGRLGRMTTLSTIIFDCADPAALAAFYAKATGWRLGQGDADYATVEGGPVTLAFQRVDGYGGGPGWPGGDKHLHLDFQVPDVGVARGELVALGASVPDFQPGEDEWTVFTDPEGHPFCVSAA